MKKIMLFLLIGVVFFLSSCGTNNYCKIDDEALKNEARNLTLQSAELDFLATNPGERVVSEDYILSWVNASGTNRQRSELYVADFLVDFENDNSKNSEYSKAYKAKYGQLKTSCITLTDINSEYDPDETLIRKKTWIDAIKQGPIELLIIFPVSNLIIFLTNLFGGTAGAAKSTIAVASIASIVLVTILIRLLMTAATFKSTLKAQKMQELQPEVAEIQKKYRGINTVEARQKQSQEIMRLYQKHDIKMFATMIGPILTIPIFFAMWAAINETWILKQGVLFDVNMGAIVSSRIFSNTSIFVIIIYLLSIAAQFVLVKMPQWKQKARMKKKHQVMDQAMLEQQKKNATMSYMMLAIVMFFGLSMPFGMLFYLITSNIFSIGSSFVIEKINNKKSLRGKR